MTVTPPCVRRGRRGRFERQCGVPLAACRCAALASERQGTAERWPPVRRQSVDTHAKRDAARQAYVPRTVEKTILRRARVRIALARPMRGSSLQSVLLDTMSSGAGSSPRSTAFIPAGVSHWLSPALRLDQSSPARAADVSGSRMSAPRSHSTGAPRTEEGRRPPPVRLVDAEQVTRCAEQRLFVTQHERSVQGEDTETLRAVPEDTGDLLRPAAAAAPSPGTGPARLEAHRPRSVDEEETDCVRLPAARCRP